MAGVLQSFELPPITKPEMIVDIVGHESDRFAIQRSPITLWNVALMETGRTTRSIRGFPFYLLCHELHSVALFKEDHSMRFVRIQCRSTVQ